MLAAALPILIFFAVAGLVVGVIYASVVMEKKRTKKVEEIAGGMGLVFSATGDSNLQSRLGAVNLFTHGRDRRLINLVSGATEECTISIFDYQYTTGSGKHSQTHKSTIAALESTNLKNPAFTLRPEDLFDKIGGMLGFQDIDFPDHEEFSRSFVLKGPEEAEIRSFFNKTLLDFFSERAGSSVEAIPGMMIYYIPGRRRKPEEFAALLEEAYKVFGAIVDK
jgi:hypothetical protein